MLIIPAIDIKEGKVVRLVQGRFKKKIYSISPVETALYWQKEGARLLHIVDLEGAQSGNIKNFFFLKKILDKINIPVQFGGGVRDITKIKKLLDMGIYRVIIGTKVEDDHFLKESLKCFGKRIIISIDESRGKVMTAGWMKSLKQMDIFSLIERLKEIGFKEIIYTNVLRDGTLLGPDTRRIKQILSKGLKVIVSGGISSLADIQRLKPLEKLGLRGVIIGKALYEGKVDLKEAIKLSSN
ncbi:MAG: 1-(5-phosphoribosyl)-5-[(5-phosphoribosylamino)methylideneamino]imidazole-4-carboxamide isomerase [Candidatus Omnitrophica bacterium]|nr:1-(5-phosphoribosyl)-5-[(5-phosphoribosylamino)methylideneamino]imidazole-4-carboxamide isomerase [Candidatus Omnitrophota bacterium]